MKQSGEIFSKHPYPSPNPHIQLNEIIYWSNGFRVKGLLAEPKGKGNYEGILYLRGGIQRIGMVRPSRIAQFAAQGFVVFAPYYRGNRGGEGFDEFAGDDRYDAVHAVDVLKRFIKVHRIHIFSFSRGGIMALWTAILRNDITSLVTWAGVSDASLTYEERKDMRRMMKRVIGGTPSNHPELYHARTPLHFMDEFKPPVLIIHGLKDQHVRPLHAKKLEENLQQKNSEVKTWYFDEYTHHFPPDVNAQVVRDLTTWMRLQKGELK
ncbi:MAG: prolyl oligopeptidase family serine peptidase [Paenisporosarcina sp.]